MPDGSVRPLPADVDPLVREQIGGRTARELEADSAAMEALRLHFPPEKLREMTEGMTPEEVAILLDVLQLGLDIGGVFEPTPFCDLTNAAISVARGELLSAGGSVAGAAVPYAGDVGKIAAKVPKYLQTIARITARAKVNPAFAQRILPWVEPIAKRMRGAGEQIRELGDTARKQWDELTEALDGLVRDLRKVDSPAPPNTPNSGTERIADQVAGPGQRLAGQIDSIARMRPFADRLAGIMANPSRWKVVRSVSEVSANIRNRGGRSLQELLRNEETGETIVRHTIFKADGSIFELPHYRPVWKQESLK